MTHQGGMSASSASLTQRTDDKRRNHAHRLPMFFSTTALLVAVLGVTPLGEAAYNAVVPRNSVGTLQLQRNAVKAAKIAPNAIRTGHVLNGSLLGEDFKAGQIPQGPKGDKGDKGDKGAPGATTVPRRNGSGSAAGPGVSFIGGANCQAAEIVVGGGATWSGSAGSKPTLTASWPNTAKSWFASVRNDGAGGTVTGARTCCVRLREYVESAARLTVRPAAASRN
jgi:hypothetical protein